MGVDFAAAGLLDDLEGEARAARLELLERLHDQGATLDELRDAVADGLLVFLLAERGALGLETLEELEARRPLVALQTVEQPFGGEVHPHPG